MILDAILILILVLSMLGGRKTGVFRMAARLVSFALSWFLTAMWGRTVKEYLVSTPLYLSSLEKLSERIADAVAEGKPGIFSSFLYATGQNAAFVAAQGMLDMLLSGVIFFLFLCLIRLAIFVIDKTVLHLPIVKPVNKFLGMAVSGLLALAILYIVAGAVGGAMLCAESEFWRSQMESSYLFSGMYENNIVLNWIIRKGGAS